MDLHWLPIEQCIQDTNDNIQDHTKQGTKVIMDLLKPDKPKRGNMQSNKSGLKLKVPPIKYNTFAAR